MTDSYILTFATSLVAVFFGLLVTILGWLGNKIYTSLDMVNGSIRQMEREITLKLNDMDRRITRIEATHNAGIFVKDSAIK